LGSTSSRYWYEVSGLRPLSLWLKAPPAPGQFSCEAPPLDQVLLPTSRHCQAQRPSTSEVHCRTPLSVAADVPTLVGRLVWPAQPTSNSNASAMAPLPRTAASITAGNCPLRRF